MYRAYCTHWVVCFEINGLKSVGKKEIEPDGSLIMK
jgi:hypothetical protein